MIKPLQIRSAVFGTGMPKICIPLTSSGKRDLANEARALLSASPDLVEWRVDYFEQSDSLIEVRMMLSALRDILKAGHAHALVRHAGDAGEVCRPAFYHHGHGGIRRFQPGMR